MKDEDFAFNIGALLGFSIGFFPGLFAGAPILGLTWRAMAFCMAFSLLAKFGTRTLNRMMAAAAEPRIEEIQEPPRLTEELPQEMDAQGDEPLAANA
tara:strand:+ start:74 stop:364 length:291 start_codon:yes stop_codon:yes gene_type:complete